MKIDFNKVLGYLFMAALLLCFWIVVVALVIKLLMVLF